MGITMIAAAAVGCLAIVILLIVGIAAIVTGRPRGE
jgi:hypothetical protein